MRENAVVRDIPRPFANRRIDDGLALMTLEFRERRRARRIGPGGRKRPWRQRERDPNTQRLPVGFWQMSGGAVYHGLRAMKITATKVHFGSMFRGIWHRCLPLCSGCEDTSESASGRQLANIPSGVRDATKYQTTRINGERQDAAIRRAAIPSPAILPPV